ncbi:virulence RhuM family protein [Corynebacterium gerontici]|uniref:Bro-N domain-containing protein n=1 Tax=Corynebacterium gerontici TaxID=2079234 RepID=A0A3G6IYE1_9CORY|nr:virulence RhuM family protein [Corynebacterium gerontici]AZA10801.1 hypothetical protein CGERO_02385 [Corynebacterium gerontici]
MSRQIAKTSSAQFLQFAADSSDGIQVRYEEGTLWLTQKQMAGLFDVDVRTINEHLLNIYDTDELVTQATIRIFRIVQTEGSRQVSREVKHYNLDAIIAVGFRVNSARATEFRQWAINVLRSFTLRGYVIDRQRMESGQYIGEDYFEELLQEVREIRLSERRFYQKVTDIYATAIDYNQGAPTTKQFFATVQNKMHYAVHGHTAVELIKERADATQPHMGLTTWKNAPDGKILRSDVTVGKNYLNQEELTDLSGLVSAYLDLAESRARRGIPTTMEQWVAFLDDVLKLDSRELLHNAGKISQKIAQSHALEQFEQFRIEQDRAYVSDFDRFATEALQAAQREEQ